MIMYVKYCKSNAAVKMHHIKTVITVFYYKALSWALGTNQYFPIVLFKGVLHVARVFLLCKHKKRDMCIVKSRDV